MYTKSPCRLDDGDGRGEGSRYHPALSLRARRLSLTLTYGCASRAERSARQLAGDVEAGLFLVRLSPLPDSL